MLNNYYMRMIWNMLEYFNFLCVVKFLVIFFVIVIFLLLIIFCIEILLLFNIKEMKFVNVIGDWKFENFYDKIWF